MSTSIAPSGYGLDSRDVGPLEPLRLHHRRRHRRMLSLLAAVLLPLAAAGAYLYGYAADQYVTEFRFTVRHQSPLRMDTTSSSASLLMGGGAALAVINDSQIVIQYLKSRQIIDDIAAAGVDLDAIYAGRDKDFFAHLRRGAPVEERLRGPARNGRPVFRHEHRHRFGPGARVPARGCQARRHQRPGAS